MLILPIRGDKLTLSDGRLMSVDSFSNFSKSPSVLAHQDGDKPSVVSFNKIKLINGTKVKLLRGGVFEVPGTIDRKIHLPQPDDIVTCLVEKRSETLKVIRLLLSDESTPVLMLETENDLKQKLKTPASSIISLKRASGNSSFSTRSFQTLYTDYLG